METDPSESDPRSAQKRMLEQIVVIPATFYFPACIVAELKEICEVLGYTAEQLVIEALKDQIDHWDEFYQYVNTPPEKPEDFVWPEDPLFCLACVATVHFINSFTRCFHNPVAFEQLEEHAPAEWSFRAFEEQDDLDPADWWKRSS
jgi:hypothetical protein